MEDCIGPTQAKRDACFDFIGLGFGPANLALAIAAEERASLTSQNPASVYLDIQREFNWHHGMLLDDSRLQVVFLKDLITMVNPRSRYTFINYLHQKGRLHEFMNLRTFYPTRAEYNDYYKWVAAHFDPLTRYGRQIRGVTPVVEDDGSVNSIDVSAENLGTGEIETYRSRNLAVALGGTPIIPEAVHRRRGARAFHSSECLYRLKDTFEDIRAAHEFVVVGSGQTAADILHHLIRTYPNAKISLCMREFAFKPQDDTHFVNELFFPETTDMFFDMREPNRRALLAKHKDVTHSAVDVDLLPLIYDAIYQDNVSGRHRLTIQRFFELESAEESEDSVSAIFRNHARECSVEIRCDALIMATGYDRNAPLDILDELRPFLASDRNGQFQVERNYNIKRLPGFRPKIYLEGYCEATHGFSEILLSLLPIRSLQIINDMFTDEVGLADMELSERLANADTAAKVGKGDREEVRNPIATVGDDQAERLLT